jgi:NitT/TauT family transport system substrate-binding protein
MTRATMGVPNSKIIIDNQGILEPRNFVVMNKEWLDKNQPAANAFMKALVEAANYYKTNPNEAVDIVVNKIKLEKPLTAALIDKIKVEVRLVEDSLNHLKKTEAQIASSGKLTKPVVWKDILYPGPLLAVAPDKVDSSIPR